MAGRGRPKGQRGHNPVRAKSLELFTCWRSAGEPMIIDLNRAYHLTDGAVGATGSDEKVSLAAVALSFSIHLNERI